MKPTWRAGRVTDIKGRIADLADRIAYSRYGAGYYDLTEPEQHEVYQEASDEVYNTVISGAEWIMTTRV